MAPTAAPLRYLPPGSEFKPSAHHIIPHFLVHKALYGYTTAVPCLVAEGVDVFSTASPAVLFFDRVCRTDHGKVWGYYYGDYPIGDVWQVPGGRWARYGPEKAYVVRRRGATEAVAFRRRFAFHEERWGDDGSVVLVSTPWRMKEYRLHKSETAFRAAAGVQAQANPRTNTNLDCVVRKVFAKLPPPFGSADVEVNCPGGRQGAGYASDKESRT